MRPEFLDNGPVGSIGRANESGWMTEELFTEWFQHFLNHIQPHNRIQPTLLLADGHVSHTRNLDVIRLAREHNVMQPLDVAIFKILKWNYDNEV